MQALARIERALDRVEAAAVRRGGDGGGSEELARVREAHLALRGKVEGAIGRIDRLLDGGGAA